MNGTNPNIPAEYRRRVADARRCRVSIGNSCHNNMVDLATLKAMVAGMASTATATAGTATTVSAARSKATAHGNDEAAGTAAEAALYRTIYRR